MSAHPCMYVFVTVYVLVCANARILFKTRSNSRLHEYQVSAGFKGLLRVSGRSGILSRALREVGKYSYDDLWGVEVGGVGRRRWSL